MLIESGNNKRKKPATGSGQGHSHRFPCTAEDATPWRVLYASSDCWPCF